MNGFKEYVEFGEITQPFLDDLGNLVTKLYKKYYVCVPFEDYESACMIKVVESMPRYDPSYSIGNYIWSLLRNEATRLNSKYGRESCVDVDENQDSRRNPVQLNHHNSMQVDRSLRLDILSFQQMARQMCVEFDPYILYKNVQEFNRKETLSPLTKAFLWYRVKERMCD